MNQTDTLLTVKETAAYLKLNPLTVYDYIRSGKLKAIKFGRNVRILREDLDRFVTAHKTLGGAFV